ncbi:MAG: ABC transporter substrate-binding protein [Eubacteriales bacterium]|nr:ABC transporter substrate-binding protein [Eubacteriales bacterium]
MKLRKLGKKLLSCTMAFCLLTGFAVNVSAGEKENYTLRVSGIDGGIGLFPVYLAQEKGWFEEAGLNIERSGFTNGPVQMEAIDTWDIGVTGVGGVLAGAISYDAVILGTVGTDDGTQYMFVRKDTPVAKAGKGHNSINSEIVGDAESWKGMSVNCTYGNVLHYMLLKTLEGFGLTADDIEINWMDQPTCNASFLAGEGDAACVTGSVCFAPDKDEFVVATTGPLSEIGLLTNIMANPEAYKNEETREAMKTFLRIFFKATDWIKENEEEALQYMIDWCEYAGEPVDEEMAKIFLTANTYYTLEDNYNSLHEPAKDGGDYCHVQEQLLGVLKFFINTESYQQGDDEIFMRPEHIDTSLIDELYEESR